MAFSSHISDIVNLNVGGTRFSTSRQTLTWVPDTFFTSLLNSERNGRLSSLRDETDAIFIDRDPKLFSIILNYLRTKEIDIKSCDIRVLRHEAEFYNISPLIKRLMLCEEMDQSSCGDVLFYGYLPAPNIPIQEVALPSSSNSSVSGLTASNSSAGSNGSATPVPPNLMPNCRPPHPLNLLHPRHNSPCLDLLHCQLLTGHVKCPPIHDLALWCVFLSSRKVQAPPEVAPVEQVGPAMLVTLEILPGIYEYLTTATEETHNGLQVTRVPLRWI